MVQMYSDVNIQATETDDDALERDAFNAAFRELGLQWYWDAGTFRELQAVPGDEQRIRVYLESRHSHLLKAYDAAFLVEIVRTAKAQCLRAIAARGTSARSVRCPDSADFATAQPGF